MTDITETISDIIEGAECRITGYLPPYGTAEKIVEALPSMIEDLFWIGSQYLKSYSSGPYTVQNEYDADGVSAWAVGFHGVLISDHETMEAAQEAANTHRKAAILAAFKST